MNWFRNMKIQNKLFLLICVLISQIIFTNILILSLSSSVEHEYQSMSSGVMRRIIYLCDAIGDFMKLRHHNLSRLYEGANGVQADIALQSFPDHERYVESFVENMNNFRFNFHEDTSLTEAEKRVRLEILEDVFDMFVFNFADIAKRVDEAVDKRDLQELSDLLEEGIPSGNRLSVRLHELRDIAFRTADQVSGKVERYSASVKRTLIEISIGVIVISLILSMFTADSIKKPIAHMQEAMAEISKGNLEYPIRSKSNDELGELSNHIGNMVDMILEMNKTMAVMDFLDCMICIADLDYNVLYINKSMADAYGVRKENVANQKCYKALKGSDYPCSYCLLPQIMTDKEKLQLLNYDYFWDNKLGKWLGGSGAIIRWVDGSQVHLHYMQDETEKKVREEELRKAKLAAEAASSSKSAFLATMSHEIRTPMNAILGITGLLLEHDYLPKDVKEALGNIYTSGDLLLSIINDILDLSKIEAGKLELNPSIYQVASIIFDTVYLNKIKYESKPIEFKLQVDEKVPSEVFGDALRIQQILNNLLSNSFKYTDRGEVELSITAEFENEKEVTLVFAVRDTGHGMTKDQVNKLFDEYSRFNSEANRTTEGTGLGMSIARRLVSMMNGSITVESELNKGTEFVARLPQGNIGAEALGKEITENLQQSRVNDTKLKKTNIVRENMPYGSVLIVDDTEMNIYVAKGLMKPYGLKIDTVMSGFEAIERIRDGNVYDVVFMDHMMPKMDGIEATKLIRGLGYTHPIAALTANAVVGQSDMFLANGFDAFISKPIDIRQLNSLLNKLIRDKQPPEVVEEARRQLAESKTPEDSEEGEEDTISDFIASLRNISDINAEIGLNRFSGVEDMYRDTMQLFCKKLTKECENMSSFLDNKDLKNFSVLVHAMKSSLSTIGAMGLSDAALKLETASKSDDMNFCLENYPPLKEKLLSLHEHMSALFPDVSTESQKERGDVAFLRENIEKALSAAESLENDECEEALNNLLGYDYGEQTNNLLKKAMDAISDFKCGEASIILREILNI